MSMLDGGPDVLTVYPEIEVEDGYGGTKRVPGPTAVQVRGRFQPRGQVEAFTAGESASTGQEVDSVYRFICRVFPGGAFAKAEFDGREWEVLGEPRRHRGSPRTRHDTVMLKAKTPQSLEA